MIIDQTPLAGAEAYLTSSDGRVNLAEGSGRAGATQEIAEGLAHEIDSMGLLLEGEDLLPLYARQEKPLFTIELTKEMFPGLFRNPYASRVHQLAGLEALRRGEFDGMQAMEVNGVPTLVTLGDSSAIWRSAIYRLPKPTTIADIAWDLAPSRKTHKEAFRYQIDIEIWRDSPEGPSQTQAVVTDRAPDEERFRDSIDLERVAAFRLGLRAAVRRDQQMQELMVGLPERDPLGLPLLQAIYLREPVASRFAFSSLLEVTAGASQYHLFEEAEGPARRLLVHLPFAATLLKGESISLTVMDDRIKRLEARLNALVLVRKAKRSDEV